MKKVFFLNSWGENHYSLLDRYKKQTPKSAGVWKDIIGVSDIRKADYCIILGGNRTRINFDPEKTIYVKREPDFIELCPSASGHVILWKNIHCGITWWLNKSYDELKAMNYLEKNKEISCIVSTKHTHRFAFVEKIMEKNNLVDLFGRGHKNFKNHGCYKGSLEYDGNCKFLGLSSYRYSIVLENSQEKNYWTEKLADAFLGWCVPVYWGCPNIGDYFDRNSYKTIDIEDPDPLGTIREIISKPVDKSVIESIGASRNKILDEYNIWEVIRKKIKEIGDS
jgi:hypothetical protein